MSEEKTGEEEVVVTETETEEPAKAEKVEGENPETKTENPKEQNRKGYELRKNQEKKEEEVSLSKKLDEVSSKVEQLTTEKNDLEFRRNNPEVSDDLFNLIKSTAKGSGKSYTDTLKDPIISKVLESDYARARISGATPPPSTRTSSSATKNIWDMSDDEFKEHQNEVLLRGGR